MLSTNERSLPIELQRGMSGHDLERIVFPVWKRAEILLCRWFSDLWQFAHVLRLSIRSLVGHIEILLSKNLYCYGPVVEEDTKGHLFWNRRTCARVQSIQELRARFHWASSIEEEFFLLGFDKGEEFAHRLPDIPLSEIPPSTWVDPTTSPKRKHPA